MTIVRNFSVVLPIRDNVGLHVYYSPDTGAYHFCVCEVNGDDIDEHSCALANEEGMDLLTRMGAFEPPIHRPKPTATPEQANDPTIIPLSEAVPRIDPETGLQVVVPRGETEEVDIFA